MKKLAILLSLSLLVMNGMGQERRVYDRSSNPKSFYLYVNEVPSCLKLLPPPPQPGSAHFEYDKAQYEWGKSLRNTERGQLAIKDADSSDTGVIKALQDVFGIDISVQTTPEIFKLVTNMKEDFGALATGEAKNYYKRPRPFLYFNEDSSIPEVQRYYKNSGSYPSGHTAIGWGEALVLSEINVMNQEAILQRGYEIGQSRVIAGFHYQSDVDAGRWMSSAIVARLHANKDFVKQLKKAKKEFAKLNKKGLIKKVEIPYAMK